MTRLVRVWWRWSCPDRVRMEQWSEGRRALARIGAR